MALTDLNTLINASAQNLSQFKGLSAAYSTLLGGVPSIAGYTKLINDNNTSNFGSNSTVVFNDENVYINVFNALYQGNPDAKAMFDARLAGAASAQDKLNAVYDSIVPAGVQTDAGRAYFLSQAEFYANRAAELKIEGPNAAAVVAYASLTKIVVDADLSGLGDTINDLRSAIADGSALLPETSDTFTSIETADGANFDADDVSIGATLGLTPGNDFADTNGAILNNGFIQSDFKFSNANELVSASAATLTGGDTLLDSTTTDQDRLVYTGNQVNSFNLPAAIQNIENFDVALTNANNSAANLLNVTGLKVIKATGSIAANQQITFTGVAASGLASVDTTALTGGANAVFALADGLADQSITYRGGAVIDVVQLRNGDNDIATGAGDDQVFVNGGKNKIDTGDGHDTVVAGNGDNEVSTGAGNDLVAVGNGVNKVNTGAGDDQVSIGNGNNTVSLGDGTNFLGPNVSNDGNNTVTGGSGVDTINLGNGNNTISTGAGDDIINVGTGNNTITPGAGADQVNLSLGGVHTIVFAAGDSPATAGAFDQIGNFEVLGANRDKLDFADGPAGTAANLFTNAVDAGNFATALANAQGQFNGDVTTVYYAQNVGGNTLVFVDVNADNVIDFAVQLTGVNTAALTFSAFV